MSPTKAGLEGLRAKVAAMPRQPGVYQWKAADGTILYVGKAIDLRSRTQQYLEPRDAKTQALMEEAQDLDFFAVHGEKEALLLEQTLIKRHRPRFNVRLTDDKQYPYIALTNEPYPRLIKTHRHLGPDAVHFGPFPDGYGAFRVMQALGDLLPLRRCRTLPKEKCLYYDLGKCIAPCINACTPEEYNALVAKTRQILAGKSTDLVRELRDRVEAAAASGAYEEAALRRDQLQGLEGVLERQHMVAERLEDRDVASIAVSGDLAAVVVLHQRAGKMVGQSPFLVRGVAGESPAQALVDFLVGFYQDRLVPRHLVVDAHRDSASILEHELRLIRGGTVTVEAVQRGDKRRWLEVAATNARLRLEQELASLERRGDGGLGALQRALELDAPPRIIEGFDISHRSGQFTRAALVRFVDGKAQKAGYRTFSMRGVGEQPAPGTSGSKRTGVSGGVPRARRVGREVDDVASIREAVQRRYRGVLERGEELPNLVVVDGGVAQLSAARSALEELGLVALSICSLAKKEELVHSPRHLQPIRLPRHDAGLQLLQRIRDEAHRFGIQQVRRKATASVLSGPLDAVEGIGPKRRIALLSAFGGLEGLRQASVADLQQVPGITAALAARIQAVLQAP